MRDEHKAQIIVSGPWTNDNSDCLEVRCNKCSVELLDADSPHAWTDLEKLVNDHLGVDDDTTV